MNYNDDYPACEETYTVLGIFTGEIIPDLVTHTLNITPSDLVEKGKIRWGHKKPATFNGWFLSSKEQVESMDSRRHIDWLLAQLAGKEGQLRKIVEKSEKAFICCYWVSGFGHGGPTLSKKQMEGLIKLGLDLEFEIHI